ncbi:MAG: NAD-dependent epimerase/dehydratase family protein [Pseudomonadota bacterium]
MAHHDRIQRRVCLVGAGFISQLHAEALSSRPGMRVQAIVDPHSDAARRLAGRWQIPAVHSSLNDALEAGGIDAVHVLTPPNLHEDLTRQALKAGLPTLVEKPLTPSKTSSAALTAFAESEGVTLGVNQNVVFHPAFVRLKALLDAGACGRLKNLTCIYRMPLRQLQGRQFGHWMFQAPQNLLLEQAVHPLSQIRAIVPDAALASVTVGDRLTLGAGNSLLKEVDVSLRESDKSVQFHFDLGADFPHWELIASCTDGIIHADIVNNRCYTRRWTRWLEPSDQMVSGLRTAAELAGSAIRGAVGHGLSMVKLRSRSDSFYLSMKGSIDNFHQALDRQEQPLSDGGFATDLVDLCEQITVGAGFKIEPAGQTAKTKPKAVPSSGRAAHENHDLLLIGGTGFIGRAVLKQLADDGRRIAVLARNITNLSPDFEKPNITLVRGSFTDPDAVGRAMAGCRQVVHLAHGMGSGGDLIETMRAGTRLIAEQCLDHGVERLVYISSIAALYLGDAADRITAATPTDPRIEERGEYGRAKALCDQDLFALHKERGLPVVILRPALVVGEGGMPLHGGLGFYNNDQHCMGWSAGHHPLPFVLVEDVASAILGALEAESIEGNAYNIAGDVRISARRYMETLASALGRPLRYHGQSVNRLYAVEWAKWCIKRLSGRQVPPPSRRDLASRALFARFDCTTEKRDLDWRPNADEAAFIERGIKVHGDPVPAMSGEIVDLTTRSDAADDERKRYGASGA